jgi:hypothetical protein
MLPERFSEHVVFESPSALVRWESAFDSGPQSGTDAVSARCAGLAEVAIFAFVDFLLFASREVHDEIAF